MSFDPFFAAPLVIKVHLLAAFSVLVLTPVQFALTRKGSALHRAAGYCWLGAMTIVALSSFMIPAKVGPNIAGFGPIHGLSLWALVSVVEIIRHARAHRHTAHRAYVIGLTVGFAVAGAFTVFPGRFVGRIFGI
jgi:uncharacterized membrane protein